MAGKLGDMWETLDLSLHVCTYVKSLSQISKISKIQQLLHIMSFTYL